MKIRHKLLFSILLLSLCFVSCRKNPYKVSVSSIKADIEIKRLEKDLFTINPEEITIKLPELKDKYGNILQLFSYAINTGDVNDPSFGDFLARFCTDKQNSDVFGLTMKHFPELTSVERNLEDAFRHYKYYFPDKVVPEVFSCITGFNASIITMSGEPALGIGLDKYLGADCEYYPGLGIYTYMSARMKPEYIVPDCMYGWGAAQWDFTSMNYSADNVLAEMIHEGKLRYFVRCMLPETEDEIIFGFTPDQMKFCRNNEGQMWQYMVENDLFFKTDQFTIRKLVGDAPFTSYFTNESPGRAAVWLGFRIIESYMNKNKGTSLESIMKDINVQEILEKARYNPQ
ncbi:MAG: hypothetical protein NTY95_11580 [Bacteroidia bacterium]|nr:hypothetical protein [Bacteroidia bacterium]